MYENPFSLTPDLSRSYCVISFQLYQSFKGRQGLSLRQKGGGLNPELQLVEALIGAVLVHQFFMTAYLRDPALVQHDDPVSVLDRGEAVRDDQNGPALHQIMDRFLH